jgi:hypothetical protein
LVSELFTDGIGEVAITGPVVRIDLLTLSLEDRDEKGQPKPVPCQRVVMPIEGMLRSYAVLTQVMRELEKRGLVRRAEAPAGDAGAVSPTASGPASPNFPR